MPSTQRFSAAGNGYQPGRVERDGADHQRKSAAAAMLMKFDSRAFPIKEDLGREYMSMSLMEIAKERLEAAGISHRGESKSRIAELALSTSDFPLITADVANKTLRAAYDAAQRTFIPFCRQVCPRPTSRT